MASKHRRQRSTGSMLNGSITNLFQKTLNPAHHMRGRIVKKAAGVVDEYVNDMSSKAPFLCESTTTSTSSSIPLLDHNELVIGKLLGEGGFCQVWDVTGIVLHTDNNNNNGGQNEWRNQQDARQQLAQCAKQQPLAVKQLRKRLTKYPPRFTLACADLVTEAQYLSKLSHPHIVPIRAMTKGHLTSMQQDGRYDAYFFVMDQLEATLDQRIHHWRRGSEPMPEYATKLDYALQMASALQYLHQRRIIFRDVKPANIGFRADNRQLQLFDFGLCRELPLPRNNTDTNMMDNSTFMDASEYSTVSHRTEDEDDDEEDDDVDLDDYYLMTKVGTRRYAAVEMFISGRYNEKIDCYSWAMTVFEMVSLCKPFASLSDADHQELVCAQGRRPNTKAFLQMCEQPPRGEPQPLLKLVREAWEQYVRYRIDIHTIVERLEEIIQDRRQQDGSYPDQQQQSDKAADSVVSATTVTVTESDHEELLACGTGDTPDNNHPAAPAVATPEDDARSIHSLIVVTTTTTGGANASIAGSRHSNLSSPSLDPDSRSGNYNNYSHNNSHNGELWGDDSINSAEMTGGMMMDTSLNHIVFDELLQHRRRAADFLEVPALSPLGSPTTDQHKKGAHQKKEVSSDAAAALTPPSLLIAKPTTLSRIVSGGELELKDSPERNAEIERQLEPLPQEEEEN